MPVDIGLVTGIVTVGIIVIGVIGNVLTLFVIICYHPLRDVTGMFLANLAVADFLQCTFGMPLIAASAFRRQWVFGEALCTISGLTNSLFCITSVLTLTAISVDRWLAIVHPLKYRAWLTVVRGRIVLAYIWLQALSIAVLPVLGWSRYAYLSYEFICTVQWEYDKAFSIFLSVTCFVTPLIVTVVCYSSILRVARRQARDKLPVKVGTFSFSEHAHSTIPDVSKVTIPDVSKSKVVDGKIEEESKKPGKVVCGKENRAFLADSESNKVKAYLLQGESESTVVKLAEHNNSAVQGPSRIVKMLDQDPDHRRHVAGSPENVVTGKDRKNQNSASPSDENKMSHLNPFVIVVTPRNTKTPANHSADPNINPSGRIGKSRVIPAVVVSSATNLWIEENPQREDLMVDQEKDKKTVSRKDFVSQIRSAARKRRWMAERRTQDKRTKRKEMKVALILVVVNGTFILCWLPHFIGMTCLIFTNGSCPFPDSFFMITTTLAMLNSGCNPFIYTLTYRKFRHAFQRVLPCFRSDHTGNWESTVF